MTVMQCDDGTAHEKGFWEGCCLALSAMLALWMIRAAMVQRIQAQAWSEMIRREGMYSETGVV